MKGKLADTNYFYSRVIEELKLAQESGNPAAVAVHLALAKRYLDRICVSVDGEKEQKFSSSADEFGIDVIIQSGVTEPQAEE